MNKILLSTIIALFTYSLNAQIVTDELPYGLTIDSLRTKKQDIIVLPVPDRIRINREDSINDAQPGPIRFAYPVQVNYTLKNSGEWQKLDDNSKIWRLKVKLPGALSTNTMYDQFWLPEGAKFFVYSEDTKQYIGAITSEYIGGSRENPIEFATAIIYGENVIFEYYQPASVNDSAVISISRIDYGYRYVNNPYVLKGFGDSGSCEININFSEGNQSSKENVKDGVASLDVSALPEGQYYLHVYSEVDENPDIREIYIKRQ
jgi:hypothetical protein